MARGAYGEIMAATRRHFREIEEEYGVSLPATVYEVGLKLERLGTLNRVTGEWADPATWRRKHGSTEAGGISNDAPSQL
jgi:hypothetical protein